MKVTYREHFKLNPKHLLSSCSGFGLQPPQMLAADSAECCLTQRKRSVWSLSKISVRCSSYKLSDARLLMKMSDPTHRQLKCWVGVAAVADNCLSA